MNKRELIAALARQHGDLKVKDVDLAARVVFETLAEAIVEGRDVELRGFGSFRQRAYPPRIARNPGTGEKVDLGERRGIVFRPALEMKEKLNDD